MRVRRIARAAFAVTVASCAVLGPAAAQEGLAKIKTIVVIYGENRSFDHLYGFFPGANGIANATAEQKTQLDHDGRPLTQLTTFGADGKPDPRFPRVPNGPFLINSATVKMAPDKIAPSPIHAFFHHQEQINGGRNNMFAAMSTVGGWTMGHFDTSRMRLWQWAKEYTLADNFFMGAFGGSYLNHQWLVCACTPEHKNAPAGMRARLDADGKLEKTPESPSANDGAVQVYSSGIGGQVTRDGYSVNTSQPPYQPSGIPPAPGGDPNLADLQGTKLWGEPVPPQTARTIGDTLSAKNITWAWYAGSWNVALADGRRPPEEKRRVIYNRDADSPNFQPHHHPFNFYARFAPGTPDRVTHLKDGEDFLRSIDNGTLPAVVFYKPAGRLNQHPAYTDLATGDAHIADVLERLRISPQWDEMAVIVTYDENGGFWDHVPPPTGPGSGDRFGPGTRVPTLIISPFARKGFVDKTSYDTTSILKLISRRFDLEPLAGVRANAGNLTAAFDFTQP
ncbi:MAG: acid phosphatase [Alphaproteobacteria bacterium]|nr:MAG: acid phosphatase [Alphaproteobacteria bacterium]